jgi:hypothetical protein
MPSKRSTFLILFILLQASNFLLFLNDINLNESIGFIPMSYAHLDHLPHYNSGGNRYAWGNYSSYMALEPEYGIAEQEPTAIEFSVQDRNNNDVYDVTTMIEIYETNTGDRIHVFPWTFREIGDFMLYYTFPRIGSYQIVLSTVDEPNIDDDDNYLSVRDLIGYAAPPRSILSDTTDCNCERTVFNITISPAYGNIQNIMFAVIIIFPLTILGVILVWKYRSHRNRLRSGNDFRTISTRREYMGYMVMLLAIAGGILHLAVFPDHVTLHIYYSLFLLAAAASQVTYGILFALVTLSNEGIIRSVPNRFNSRQGASTHSRKDVVHNYRRNMILNLFGLFGTSVLIGLYIYSVILPPPLSPIDSAEEIEIEGIGSKIIEAVLIIGIILIIKWDRQQMKEELVSIDRM